MWVKEGRFCVSGLRVESAGLRVYRLRVQDFGIGSNGLDECLERGGLLKGVGFWVWRDV